MERRLAAILAADMVGYSRLMAADEAGTLVRHNAHRNELIDPRIAEYGGRTVKSTGDGVLVEFPSVVDALCCAVTIQLAMTEREPGVAEENHIAYRIGINLGEIIIEDDDIFGNGVNVAARLEALAEPGGICVSRTVVDQVRGKVSSDFEDQGEQQVKNIPEPVQAFRVLMQPEAAGTFSAGRGAVAAAIDRGKFRLPDRPSVAVLSLDTFNNDEEQRFLAEGIAEDIITQLARNSALTVMARTATFALRDKGLSAKEIANILDVHYILEGSVRRAGDMLRISAQLIDAETGNHVWAERYDTTAATIYLTQDNIVEKIVGTLFSEIREAEKAGILRRPPSNLDVYELTLRGLARKHRLNPESIRLAREDLQRAVELDPEYAPAWLYLGWVEALAIVYKWNDDLDFSDLDGAIGKVEKAIELDPVLATAYQALGLLRAFDGDAQGALEAAKRSVELGPGDADNLLFLARAQASVGEFDQAIARTRHAIALNPSRPSYYDYNLSRSLWGHDEFEEISRATNECLTKSPGFTACRVFQIVSHVGMGNTDQASQAVTALLEQSPSFTVEDALTSVGFPGDENSNERLAKQLIEAGMPQGKGAPVTQ